MTLCIGTENAYLRAWFKTQKAEASALGKLFHSHCQASESD